VDASLEVAVPRKDARGPEILGVDRTFDRLGKRAGVPDTGRTAVADDVVAEVFEVREKPRRFEIFGDDAASGRETRLDVRGDVEPALDSVTSEEARRDHHGRIRRVRTTGDGADDDTAVPDFGCLAVAGLRRAARGTSSLAVHVDCDSFVEVADIRFRKIGIRSVVGSAALAEPSGDRFLVDIVEFLLEFAVDQSPEVRLHVAHRDAILGLLRTGEAGSRREVELYRFRVFGILFAE